MSVDLKKLDLTWDQVVEHHRTLKLKENSIIRTVLNSDPNPLVRYFTIDKIELTETDDSKENIMITARQVDARGQRNNQPAFLNGRIRLNFKTYEIRSLRIVQVDDYFDELAGKLLEVFPKTIAQMVFNYIIYHNTRRCQSPILQIK